MLWMVAGFGSLFVFSAQEFSMKIQRLDVATAR
jgi:hypothetical protein